MEGGRTASGVPLLPRVAVPMVDTQAVRDLLSTISSGGYNAQLAAAVQLASLLEAEEGRFRDVVGDPWGGPAGQRASHSIGRLLACIREREAVYDNVCESWLLSRSAPLDQQVAGSRLVLACVSCWGFQYPLTEDRCLDLLLEWAGEAGDSTPTPADPPPADDEALLREARSVYATGLLAIAMTNEDYAGPASSTPLVPRVAKYLRTALLDQAGGAAAEPPPAAPEAPKAPPPLPATDAAAAPRALCHPLVVLRRLRLQYCAALLAAVGEYVDALGPVLAERGAEALLELMRRAAAAGDGRLTYDTLAACVALTAHRRFSEQLVEAGGVELALSLPRNPHTFSGLAMLLYSLAAAPLAFERLLTPPPPPPPPLPPAALSASGAAAAAAAASRAGPGGVIAAALSLLSCGQDLARKTAVTFLSSCMHFPATLRAFQAQDGVRRMLNLLRALLTSLRSEAPPDLRMERQVGYYAALTIRMFVATHLVLHVGALKRSLAAAATAATGTSGGSGGSAGADGTGADPAAATAAQAPVLPYRPVDTSREALDAVTASLESDRRLAEAFVRCRWPALEHLLDAGAPALLLELVSALPPERWFDEAARAALESVRLLSLAPLARRAVLAAVVPVGGVGGAGVGGGHRSGVGVLLSAATLSTSAFFTSDPETVAEALSTLTNLVTPPPSLASLLAAAAAASRGAAGGGGAAALPSGVTPARRPERASHGNIELQPAAVLQTESAAVTAGLAAGRRPGGEEEDGQTAAGGAHPGHAPGAGPTASAAPTLLGQALEAGYVQARQVVRQANGIRALMQLLQPRHGQGPNAVPAAALDRIRALACRALVGLAGDPAIRHILTRLQLARLLSDLMREPVGAARRPAGVPLEPGLPYQRGSGVDWHAAFMAVALDLIALTTTGTGLVVQRHGDKFVAANDATAPALHKIERAAIAAASHVSYSPQELLLLVYEHLMASGLHASAATLAAEANLAKASAALHKLLQLTSNAANANANAGGSAAAPAAPAPPAGGEAAAPAAPYAHEPLPPPPAAAAASQHHPPSQLASAACTPYTGGGGTARKGRSISISAALRDAATVRSRSDLSHDLARLHQQPQRHESPPGAAAGPTAPAAAPPPPPPPAAAGESPALDGPRSCQLKRRASMPLPPVGHPMTRASASVAVAADVSPPPASAAAAVVASPPASVGGDLDRGAATATAPAANGGARGGNRPSSAQGQGRGGGGGSRKRGASSAHPAASKTAAVTLATKATEQRDVNASADSGAAASAPLQPPSAAATPAAGASDADYLVRAFGQQHHTTGKHQRQAGPAATPQFPVRAKPLASPFAAATADRPSRPAAAGSTGAAAAAGGGALAPHAPTAAPAGGPNPLLSNLPSRRPPAHATTAAALLRRHSSNSTAVAVAGAAGAAAAAVAAATPLGGHAAPAAPAVPELPVHVEAAARDLHLLSRPPAMSKLHHIVMSYLRQQHRQAVMQCAVPTAMLPPISLSRPYVMPQASHAQDAPVNTTRRVHRRELVGGHGGRGGARADAQLIYSRFRPLRTIRDDGSLSLCAAFMHGWRGLVLGTHGGELKLQDPAEGEILDVVEGHNTAVTQLRTYDDPAQPLLLSSARADVKLWAAGAAAAGAGAAGSEEGPLPRGPRATWEGVTRARFKPDGSQVVAVSCTSARQAMIFDVRTAARIAVLDPPRGSAAGGPSPTGGGGGGGSGGRTPRVGGGVNGGGGLGGLGLGMGLGGGGGGGGGEARRSGRGGAGVSASACYSPTGEMLLWGNCLYDLRSGTAVHQFDQFTDSGSGAFHPAGLEVILNSEVWDLRTFKLLRSVPSLDGASVAFNGRGDVLYASRRQSDDSFSQLFHPRRARHPLHTAFRTLDAATYGDIATVAVERVVLDLAVEPSDSLVAVVAVDFTEEEVTSAARVYEVGRRRPADDESDAEEEEEEEEDSDGGSEDEDEELDFDGSDFDTPGPARRRANHQAGGGGGGPAAAAALRRFAREALGGVEEEGGEEGEEEEDGGGGGLRAVLGRGGGAAAAGGGGGGDEDDEDDDGGGGGDGDSDDEEMGLAMLEDAYAALEDVYGGDDDGEYDMDEQDEDEDEDGEFDEEDLEAFLEGQEEDDEDEDDDDEEDEDEDEED